MYCYKCGARCRSKDVYCRKCNGPLLEVEVGPDGKKAVKKEAIQAFDKARKNPTISGLDPIFSEGETTDGNQPLNALPEKAVRDFYYQCTSNIEDTYKRNVESIETFYKPKIEATKGRDRDQEVEYYRGALASANERRELSLNNLGDKSKARKALIDMDKLSLDAGVPLPPTDDSTKAHAFIQYVHKRRDRAKETTESSACFVVVGLILMIIGFLFFFLSFKISPDVTIVDKVLVPTSFEFIVCCVGLSVGTVLFLYGLITLIIVLKARSTYSNCLNYFSVFYRL